MKLLISGSHRSGTTWVAAMLASAGGHVIYEPLNLGLQHPYGWPFQITDWYVLPSVLSGASLLEEYSRLAKFRVDYVSAFKECRTFMDFGRVGREILRFQAAKIGGKFPIIKDPFALFHLECLAEKFHCLVLVRHPAAFVQSLLRQSWLYPESELRKRADDLSAICPQFNRMVNGVYAASLGDPIINGSLVWLMLHEYLIKLPEDPLIRIVRHEDLASDPIHEFGSCLEWMGLEMNADVEAVIRASTESTTILAEGRKSHVLKRDSRSLVGAWKSKLDDAEVSVIRNVTESVASGFYSKEDW